MQRFFDVPAKIISITRKNYNLSTRGDCGLTGRCGGSSCSGLFHNHDGQDSSGEPTSLRMGVRVPREPVQEQPLLHGCPKRGILRCCSRCGLQ